MRHFKNFFSFFFVPFFGIILFSPFSSAWTETAKIEGQKITVLELNEQIRDKKTKITSLRKQIAEYEKNIRIRRSETTSLENEIVLIEDEVAKVNLSIEATQNEIEQLSLEIQQVLSEIAEKELEIATQKERLAEYLRQLYLSSEVGYLEILLLNDSFSDFFDHVYALELTHHDVQRTLLRVRELKEQLLVQQASLEMNRKRQEELKVVLGEEKARLDERKNAKQSLIIQSILSAEKYEQLLNEARTEQSEIDADINMLEKTVRDRLHIFTGGPVSLTWPVDPSRGITTQFHDPEYPFRHIFEHPGLDIRAYQGTHIRAVEEGYVARVKQNGKTYAYIMLLHDKGLATVYGHVSRIMVDEDTTVKKGQVIGLSGGSPGTYGSGNLTTGPHLHFEVRLNGIPVDPLQYLP